ncbi:MAG TPA: hypothetical protein VG056_12750 [Pirellulales bacterium]|jgi:hypothetical protein|nr:hypothetical protein [Pirellulales bacterium]
MTANENGFTGFSLENRKAIEETMSQATRDAMLAHKRAGVPIAVSRNGKIVIVPPEEIQVETSIESNGKTTS